MIGDKGWMDDDKRYMVGDKRLRGLVGMADRCQRIGCHASRLLRRSSISIGPFRSSFAFVGSSQIPFKKSISQGLL